MKLLLRIKTRVQQLPPDEYLVETVKIASLLISIIFGITTLLVPLTLNLVYVARINTSRLDLQNGVYHVLSSIIYEGVGVVNSLEVMIDTVFTKSQSMLVSQYAEKQVMDTPQYFLYNLWNFCSIDYNTTTVGKSKAIQRVGDVRKTCSPYKWPVNFDYAEQFVSAGLGFVFEMGDFFTLNVDTASFVDRTDVLIAPGLLIAIVVQIVVLFTGIHLVQTRRDSKSNKILKHCVPWISFVAHTSILISYISATVAVVVARQDINSGLKAFGINIVIGRTWFGLFGVSVVASKVSFLFHMIPACCTNFEVEDESYGCEMSEAPPSFTDDNRCFQESAPKEETGKFRRLFYAQQATMFHTYAKEEAEELIRLGEAIYPKRNKLQRPNKSYSVIFDTDDDDDFEPNSPSGDRY